jgi:hypothetical protein
MLAEQVLSTELELSAAQNVHFAVWRNVFILPPNYRFSSN